MGRSSSKYLLCPECAVELLDRASGINRVGRPSLWSDGSLGEGLPPNCALSACPNCGTFFWLDDVHRLDKVYEPQMQRDVILRASGWSSGMPEEIDTSSRSNESCKVVRPATGDQFIAALQSGHLDAKREAYVRQQIWWHGNHPGRGCTVAKENLIPEDIRTSNLEWLLVQNESLPSDDRDVVVEAELLRELGRFSDSIGRIEVAYLSGTPRALAIHAKAVDRDSVVCIVCERDEVVIY